MPRLYRHTLSLSHTHTHTHIYPPRAQSFLVLLEIRVSSASPLPTALTFGVHSRTQGHICLGVLRLLSRQVVGINATLDYLQEREPGQPGQRHPCSGAPGALGSQERPEPDLVLPEQHPCPAWFSTGPGGSTWIPAVFRALTPPWASVAGDGGGIGASAGDFTATEEAAPSPRGRARDLPVPARSPAQRSPFLQLSWMGLGLSGIPGAPGTRRA